MSAPQMRISDNANNEVLVGLNDTFEITFPVTNGKTGINVATGISPSSQMVVYSIPDILSTTFTFNGTVNGAQAIIVEDANVYYRVADISDVLRLWAMRRSNLSDPGMEVWIGKLLVSQLGVLLRLKISNVRKWLGA